MIESSGMPSSERLTLQGFAVDHVVSAEQARAALHADDFDLAIVEIGLPKDDGLTCERRGVAGASSCPCRC